MAYYQTVLSDGWVQNDMLVARVHDELNEDRSGNFCGSDVSQEGNCEVEFRTNSNTVEWRWTSRSAWRPAAEITDVSPLQSAMIFPSSEYELSSYTEEVIRRWTRYCTKDGVKFTGANACANAITNQSGPDIDGDRPVPIHRTEIPENVSVSVARTFQAGGQNFQIVEPGLPQGNQELERVVYFAPHANPSAEKGKFTLTCSEWHRKFMLDEGINCKARASMLSACLRNELESLREMEERQVDAVEVYSSDSSGLAMDVLDNFATTEKDFVEIRQIDNFLFVGKKEKVGQGRNVPSLEYRSGMCLVVVYVKDGLNSILHPSMAGGYVHAVWKMVGERAVTMPVHGDKTFKTVAQSARLAQLHKLPFLTISDVSRFARVGHVAAQCILTVRASEKYARPAGALLPCYSVSYDTGGSHSAAGSNASNLLQDRQRDMPSLRDLENVGFVYDAQSGLFHDIFAREVVDNGSGRECSPASLTKYLHRALRKN